MAVRRSNTAIIAVNFIDMFIIQKGGQSFSGDPCLVSAVQDADEASNGPAVLQSAVLLAINL